MCVRVRVRVRVCVRVRVRVRVYTYIYIGQDKALYVLYLFKANVLLMCC
jgi:hypothetical protein